MRFDRLPQPPRPPAATSAPVRLAVAALASVFAACGSTPVPVPDLSTPRQIDQSPRLTQVGDCASLETAIEDALVLEMKSTLELERLGYSYYWRFPMADGVVNTVAGAAAAGPSSYTTTNTQVAGVAEADFVQNDGTRILVLAEGKLHVLSSWPADVMAERSVVAIDGWPREMFLAASGTQAIVLSSVYVPRALEGDQWACPMLASSRAMGLWYCGYWSSNLTQVTTIDLTDLSAPRVVAKSVLPGNYLSSRRIGDRLRLVVSDALMQPRGVSYWPNLPPGVTDAERDRAFFDLEAKNEALVRSRSLSDWLRPVTFQPAGGATTTVGYSCGDFAVSSGPSKAGILTVATIDLTQSQVVSRTSLLADAGMVYASASTLYVAAGHWWWWPMPGQRDATYVHAFDLTAPDRAGYLGSGVVDGTIDQQYGQYSFDEFEGALRVVTTSRELIPDSTRWGAARIANRISVLRLDKQAARLDLVGQTEEFGLGESAFGRRFLGSRGFVITAKQIDPLFTFDLSDPAHPVKVGELEMPGFISYLHPFDATHLLGLGRQQANGPGSPMQVKVALLDVADLHRPTSTSVALVGSVQGWTYSDALWDPKAFTFLPERGLLAIPFSDWSPNSYLSDLRLFHVDVQTGVRPVGSLSMDPVFQTWWGNGWRFDWSWSPYVRRSVLASDGSVDFVYAITDAGVRSARLSSASSSDGATVTPLRTVEFAPLPRY